MASSKESVGSSTAILFNSPVLSDVIIRQTYNSVSKDYYAHKPILSSQSDWFHKAFTGNFKEATDKIVEVHDDDPAHFEAMMKFFYFTTWGFSPNSTGLQRCKEIMGVHAVADEYGCDNLKRLDAGRFTTAWYENGMLKNEDKKAIVESHYKYCSAQECELGRAIASGLRKTGSGYYPASSFLESAECKTLKKYLEFGRDMFLASEPSGKLWD